MDKSEAARYSKANTVSVKDKKKQDGKKNYLGPNKGQNKFKNSCDQRALNVVVTHLENTIIMFKIASTIILRTRLMFFKSMII